MRPFGEYKTDETSSTVKARDYKDATDLITVPSISKTLLAKPNDAMADDLQTYVVHGTQDPIVSSHHAHALGRNNGSENCVLQTACKATSEATLSDVTMSITASYGAGGADLATKPLVLTRTPAVRRLTPVECERLQGFPDNHTAIPWRNKPDTPDGPRYKAIGNSKAVPVVQWLGVRIAMELLK